MRLYRLTHERHATTPADLLSGEGARINGGRWNSKGKALIYTATHVSLAVLETLVHSSALPVGMVIVEYDVPDASPLDRWPAHTLPRDWRSYPIPATNQVLGDAWVAGTRALAVEVPSVVVPLEMNWLVNPRHPDIRTVTATVLGPFRFDARLV